MIGDQLDGRLTSVLVEAGLTRRLTWSEVDEILTWYDRVGWLREERTWAIYRSLGGLLPRAEFLELVA